MDTLINNTPHWINDEATWRLGIFVFMLVVLVIGEWLLPRRHKASASPTSVLKPKSLHSFINNRRLSNMLLVVVSTVLVRLLVPLVPVGMALWVAAHGYGLFNLIQLPTWCVFVVSLLLLDCIIYWQHRLFHTVPLFWRLHRMHHSDTEFDFTTAVRFHPLEILLSIILKLAVVFVLGVPALAVLIFEVLLSSCALFNHSNIRLPTSVDKWLRLLLVTPDMHRVHHSIHSNETNSNYGFSIPWWDHCFNSYCAQPKDGHENMVLGLESFREKKDTRLDQLLCQPWQRR